MFCWTYLVLVVLSLNFLQTTSISDSDYAKLPKLFEIDCFDYCKLQEDSLYCSLTFILEPLDSKYPSKTWQQIQELNSDERNYEHNRLRHNICVSNICPNVTYNLASSTTSNLTDLITDCYHNKYLDLGLTGQVQELHCHKSNERIPIDKSDWIVAIVLLSYIAFVILATWFEGTSHGKSQDEYERIGTTTSGRILYAFSLRKNWNRMTSSGGPAVERLNAIQGLRFYTMVLIILSHTTIMVFQGPVSNPLFSEKIYENPLNMLLSNGAYIVQTFFMISGWLICNHFMQMIEKRKHVSLGWFLGAIFSRLMRLVPALGTVVAIHSTWLVHLGNGPLWYQIIERERTRCRNVWWTNLLFMANLIDAQDMCLQQTWYLAADMQVFVICLVVLLVIWWFPKQALSILIGSILIAVAAPGFVAYFNKNDIVMRLYPEDLYDFNFLKTNEFSSLYASCYANAAAYLIGMLFGYLYYKYQDQQTLFNNRFILGVWWLSTLTVPLAIVFTGIIVYQKDFSYTPLESALYWALGKPVFALSVAIILFGITQNCGHMLKWWFEWSAVQVMGRLTYCAYIVHVAVLRIRGGYARSPLYIAEYTILSTMVGDVALAYIFAAILCLFIEMPVTALQKLLIAPKPKNKQAGTNKVTPAEEPAFESHKL